MPTKTLSQEPTAIPETADKPTPESIVAAPINNNPVASDDFGDVVNGGTVVIPVVSNDKDPDQGDTLTIDSVTHGANGTVEISADKVDLFYTHGGSDTTTDTFTYTISDGNGGTATGTVTVTIAVATGDS